MAWLTDLRLIRFFSFYLTLLFLISTAMRLRQYHTMVSLVRRMPQRWPHLLRLLGQHLHLFLTWDTFRPLVTVFVLLVTNILASQLVWPQADEFRAGDLLALWPVMPVVLVSGLAMMCFDIYGAFRVGEFDRNQMEKYFDQAEYWLRSWKAPVVSIFTLGYINPRRIVAKEVSSALENASKLLHSTLWWVSIQTGLRITFGLALWTSYALQGWLGSLLHGS